MARLRGLRRVQPQRLRSSRSDVPPGSIEYSERPQETGMDLPAPVKGWNMRDPYASMDNLHAIKMINLYPTTGDVQARRGSRRWDSGLSIQESGSGVESQTTPNNRNGAIQTIIPFPGDTQQRGHRILDRAYVLTDSGLAYAWRRYQSPVHAIDSNVDTDSPMYQMRQGQLPPNQCLYHWTQITNEAGVTWIVAAGGKYGIRVATPTSGNALRSIGADLSKSLSFHEADLWVGPEDSYYNQIRGQHDAWDGHGQADNADWGPRVSYGWAGVLEFKNRLFWWRRDAKALFYGDLFAPGGELHSFPIQIPGQIHSLGRLTRDGGDGPDDYLVILSDDGHGIIYQGTDPSHVNTWSLVGNFWVGRPLGYRPFLQFGADLLVMTTTGIIPLSAAVRSRQLSDRDSVSQVIRGALESPGRDYPESPLWDSVIAPDGEKLIFNVPGETASDTRQFVMNTLTKAWCEFRGWNATSWAALPHSLVFGTADGKMFEADVGHMDVDSSLHEDTPIPFLRTTQRSIHVEVQQAYQQFRTPREKHFNFIEPVVVMHKDQTLDAGVIPDLDVDPITRRSETRITPAWPDGGQWKPHRDIQFIYNGLFGQIDTRTMWLTGAPMLRMPEGMTFMDVTTNSYGNYNEWIHNEDIRVGRQLAREWYFNENSRFESSLPDARVNMGVAASNRLEFITDSVRHDSASRSTLDFNIVLGGNRPFTLLRGGDQRIARIRLVVQPPEPFGRVGITGSTGTVSSLSLLDSYLAYHFQNRGLDNVLNMATSEDRYPRLLLRGLPFVDDDADPDELPTGSEYTLHSPTGVIYTNTGFANSDQWVATRPTDDNIISFRQRPFADVSTLDHDIDNFVLPTHVGVVSSEGLRSFEWDIWLPYSIALDHLSIALPRIGVDDTNDDTIRASAQPYMVSLRRLEVEYSTREEWSVFNKLQEIPRDDALGIDHSEWDSAIWNRSLWDRDLTLSRKVKVMCSTKGRTGSVYMTGDMKNAPFTWQKTMVGYSAGRV